MPDPAIPTDRPDAGDRLRFVDDMAIGSLCYFDRDWDGSWLVRRLDDLELWAFDRPLLVLAPGNNPSSVTLRPVTGAELRSLFDADRS